MRRFFGREQQFENLVLNNMPLLAPQVGLVGKSVESAAPYFRSGRKSGKGVKIDRLTLPRNKSVKTVLVYEGELDPAVEEDGFFDFVVPADCLLRGGVQLPGTDPGM